MTCAACNITRANPLSGRYMLSCLDCCARLVSSTYPDKRQANAMLAAIARHPGSPGRAAILACVRHTRERLR